MYGLGVRTLEIGMDSKRERFLRMAMAPFLMELYETCGETVNAAVWEYNGIRYIYRLESEEMLRISTTAGARFPGYCAATGKILLSYFSNEDIRQIYSLKKSFKKYTENTIASVDELIREIEKVRVKKVAIDDEEALVGVYCVAAPILNSKGECVAAISISAPKNRVTAKTSDTFAKLVSETAAENFKFIERAVNIGDTIQTVRNMNMVGIRFHGRGGQGAVVASKILAHAYFKQGLYVQAFPSFGMERKGAAVSAFVRLDSVPIVERGEIKTS